MANQTEDPKKEFHTIFFWLFCIASTGMSFYQYLAIKYQP